MKNLEKFVKTLDESERDELLAMLQGEEAGETEEQEEEEHEDDEEEAPKKPLSKPVYMR